MPIEVVRITVPKSPRGESASDLHADALKLNDSGQPARALPMLRQALELDPTHEEAAIELGNTLTDIGRADEAMTAYDGFLVTQPKATTVRAARASCLLRQSKLQEAADELRRCLHYEPSWPELHTKLIMTLCRQGLVDDARECLARFELTDPDPRSVEAMAALIRRQG